MGDPITEVDVRLFTTPVRFDAAYHGHFTCNRNKLTVNPTRTVPAGPDLSGWLVPHDRG